MTHEEYFSRNSSKISYFPVFPTFGKILSISQDSNYRRLPLGILTTGISWPTLIFGCLFDMIQMSTSTLLNFFEGLKKIIFQLSSNNHLTGFSKVGSLF